MNDNYDLQRLKEDGMSMVSLFREINERNYVDLLAKKDAQLSSQTPDHRYVKSVEAALGEVVRFRGEIDSAEIEILKLIPDGPLLEFFQINLVIEKTEALKSRIVKLQEFT
jgi:hypothetical protein